MRLSVWIHTQQEQLLKVDREGGGQRVISAVTQTSWKNKSRCVCVSVRECAWVCVRECAWVCVWPQWRDGGEWTSRLCVRTRTHPPTHKKTHTTRGKAQICESESVLFRKEIRTVLVKAWMLDNSFFLLAFSCSMHCFVCVWVCVWMLVCEVLFPSCRSVWMDKWRRCQRVQAGGLRHTKMCFSLSASHFSIIVSASSSFVSLFPLLILFSFLFLISVLCFFAESPVKILLQKGFSLPPGRQMAEVCSRAPVIQRGAWSKQAPAADRHKSPLQGTVWGLF